MSPLYSASFVLAERSDCEDTSVLPSVLREGTRRWKSLAKKYKRNKRQSLHIGGFVVSRNALLMECHRMKNSPEVTNPRSHICLRTDGQRGREKKNPTPPTCYVTVWERESYWLRYRKNYSTNQVENQHYVWLLVSIRIHIPVFVLTIIIEILLG